MNRAEKLQKEYIIDNGVKGRVMSKFKQDAKKRYRLHKVARTSRAVEINSRQRQINLLSDEPLSLDSHLAVSILIKIYGYTKQNKLKL